MQGPCFAPTSSTSTVLKHSDSVATGSMFYKHAQARKGARMNQLSCYTIALASMALYSTKIGKHTASTEPYKTAPVMASAKQNKDTVYFDNSTQSHGSFFLLGHRITNKRFLLRPRLYISLASFTLHQNIARPG